MTYVSGMTLTLKQLELISTFEESTFSLKLQIYMLENKQAIVCYHKNSCVHYFLSISWSLCPLVYWNFSDSSWLYQLDSNNLPWVLKSHDLQNLRVGPYFVRAEHIFLANLPGSLKKEVSLA